MAILTASNDITDWTGSSGVSTDTTRFDNTRVPYSITCNNFTLVSLNGNHPAPSSDTVWYHFRMKTGGGWGSADDGYWVRIRAANGDILAELDTSNGSIAARAVGDTTVLGAYATAPGAATYYNFDIKMVVNATNIIISLYVNETLVSTATAANTSGGKTVPRAFAFDLNDSSGFYFSEFIVADTDTQGMRLSRLSPTGNGNYIAYTGDFNDVSDDDPTSGVTTLDAADRESYTFPTYALTNPITAVVVTSSAAVTGSGPSQIKNSLRISTTDYDGAAQTLSASQALIAEVWALDPSDAAAWTQAKVNACESGFLSVA
jgi:hypothetical protein